MFNSKMLWMPTKFFRLNMKEVLFLFEDIIVDRSVKEQEDEEEKMEEKAVHYGQK